MNPERTVTARSIDGSTRSVASSDLSFRASVYGVTIVDGSVLLVPQWDGYDIPGGGIELGETTYDALKREIFEETGLQVEPDLTDVLHVTQDFFIHPTNGKSYHYILLYYPCNLVGGEISTANFEDDEKEYAKAAQWIPISATQELKFYNPVDSQAIIRRAEARLAQKHGSNNE